MPKDPFGLFEELDEMDLENNPVTHAAKKAGDTVATQVKTQTQTTAKAAADQVTPDASIVNALYGASTPGESGEQPSQNTGQQQSQAATDATQQKSNEQEELQKTRDLLKTHMGNYGNQFTLEAEMRKVRQQKQQAEQEKNQQEQEEAEQRQKEAQEKANELPTPQGKKSGVPDFVMKREQNKAEQNRGTSG